MLGLFRKKARNVSGEEIENFIKAERMYEGKRADELQLSRTAEYRLREYISERLDRRGSDFPPLAEYEGVSIYVTGEDLPSITLVWRDDDGNEIRRFELKQTR